MQSVELCSDMIDVVLDVSGIYGLGPSHAVVNSQAKNEQSAPETEVSLISNIAAAAANDLVDADSAYDWESASVIRLSNGMVLYLKEVDTMLALVCITRSENFRKNSLINYNIGCLKRALRALAQPEGELSEALQVSE
jgi:Ras-related GTP-binding protein C/D